MNTNDILKLIDAGFTRDEILKLDGVQPVPAEKAAAPIEESVKPAEPISEPVKPAEPVQPSGVTLSDDQFKALLQQLNVKGASLDVPPEADIKSKLAEHFKEVTIGK